LEEPRKRQGGRSKNSCGCRSHHLESGKKREMAKPAFSFRKECAKNAERRLGNKALVWDLEVDQELKQETVSQTKQRIKGALRDRTRKLFDMSWEKGKEGEKTG